MLKYLFSLRLLCIDYIIFNAIDCSSVDKDNQDYINRIIKYLTFLPFNHHHEKFIDGMFNEQDELGMYMTLKANESLQQYDTLDPESEEEPAHYCIAADAAYYGMIEVMKKTLSLYSDSDQKNLINNSMQCAISGAQFNVINYLLESSGDKLEDFNDIIFEAMKSNSQICENFCEWCSMNLSKEIIINLYCSECNRICKNNYTDIEVNKQIIKILVKYCKKNNIQLNFDKLIEDANICYDFYSIGELRKFQSGRAKIYMKEMQNYLKEMWYFYSTPSSSLSLKVK